MRRIYVFPLLSCAGLLALVSAASGADTGPLPSTVRLYGIVDMGYRATDAKSASGTQRTRGMDTSNWAPSLLGFAINEQLSTDWKAFAVLEYNIAVDVNAGLGIRADGTGFARDQLVGLGSPWGELRLGRWVTPGHEVSFIYDALLASNFSPLMTLTDKNTFRMTTTLDGASRMNNSVSYRSPALALGDGKFQWGAMTAFAGSNLRNGAITPASDTLAYTNSQERFTALRVDYTHAPSGWKTSLVTHRVSNLAWPSATAGAIPGITQREDFFGLGNKQERFGVNVVVQRMARTNPGAQETFDTVRYVNGNIEFGTNDSLRLGAGRYVSGSNSGNRAQSIALTWVHTVSKRTLLYLGGMRVQNDGALQLSAMGLGATPDAGANASGWSTGMTHMF